MAVTIDATVGGESANSYLTLAEADTYHEERLFVTDWTGATDATKNTALVWATKMLDYSFDWLGAKYTIEQALRWPRYGALDRDGQLFDSDEIPTEVKDATAELARLLIASDRAGETGTEGLKRLKVDVIELEFDKLDRVPSIPDDVYQMLSHLGRLESFSSSGGSVTAVPLRRS